jgi:HSP20 family protein
MTTVLWNSRKKSDPPDRSHRILETFGWQVRIQSHVWSPPTDVFEVENFYIVRVEIAGMQTEDFSIKLDDNYLTVSGTRRELSERRAYHQMEVRFGEFSTVVVIPGPVQAEQAIAEYNDGFLIISLPRLEPNN